ncbi:BCD family MFS transporter [Pontivivens insulae]|nr:BCD family MFS transporter [Pontivivens insulae]
MMLTWLSIIRLGLIQMALGSIVVLTTSTLNRLMVVELALPAVLPGFLVALHYGIQISRPTMGFFSDMGGRRTPWIIGGIAILGLGAALASAAVALFANSFVLGLGISVLAYAMIGLGVGASGTSVLALLASSTAPRRRAAAAMVTWLMMIAGIAVTAGVVGSLIDPYTPMRLFVISAGVAGAALVLTVLAIMGIERGLAKPVSDRADVPFRQGLAEIWAEPRARRFTLFVFLSMTAYFMQELILEPYAGLVFAFTPGQSTTLSGAQNGGVFVGMLLVGIAASGLRIGALRTWVTGGCIASAAALLAIAAIAPMGPGAPLLPLTVLLGAANGAFAVAAIGTMMQLASEGRSAREGTRMGLWGAAQALAAGFGGLAGALAVDVMRALLPAPGTAFATVFIVEAFLFLAAAIMAWRVIDAPSRPTAPQLVPGE